MLKRILAMFFALTLVFGILIMPIEVEAAEASIAKRAIKKIDEKGRFKEKIQVIGENGTENHDEIIIMVDGSISPDVEWEAVKNSIMEMGKTILEANGNTALTIMTFDMSDNIAIKHIADIAELEAKLSQISEKVTNDNSSTVKDGGFGAISDYIQKHDVTLNKVQIVYFADGEINVQGENAEVEYSIAEAETTSKGFELSQQSKVANLYLVDTNNQTSWMTAMADVENNIHFYDLNSASSLVSLLKASITNLAYAPYNDVVVTDYMSKWVNLDKATIKVVDYSAKAVIWTNKDGWKISRNRPTSQEVPVIIEEVSGANVDGNKNGTTYKLTWYVKDGEMLNSHNYYLEYEVDVDIKESGFKYDTKYPTNVSSTMEYTRKDGGKTTKITEDISAENVSVKEPEVIEEPTKPVETTEPKETEQTTTTKSKNVNIRGMMIWEDHNNRYGERPSSIIINLMADGEKVASKEVTAEDNWIYYFDNMPRYNSKGKEIKYTFSHDEVANYETKVFGYNIISTYIEPETEPTEPETINIRGTIEWKGEENEHKKRPESIVINLIANGQEIALREVTEKENWMYSFEDMLKYDADGKEIIYTISAKEVEYYSQEIQDYNVINTYENSESKIGNVFTSILSWIWHGILWVLKLLVKLILIIILLIIGARLYFIISDKIRKNKK